MESQTSIPHRHPYMRKGHSIKVDILTRQAVVSPVFRKPKGPPIVERYTKVYDDLTHDSDSESDETILLDHKLYNKYKSVFNKFSKESLINYKKYQQESNKRKQGNQPSMSKSEDLTKITAKRQKTDSDTTLELDISHKYLKSQSIKFHPFMEILRSIAGSFSNIIVPEETFNKPQNARCASETSLTGDLTVSKRTVDKILEQSGSKYTENNSTLVENDNKDDQDVQLALDYNFIRKLSLDLVSFVQEMDQWKSRVEDSLSRSGSKRIHLKEANSLLQEYEYLTSGLVSCDLVEKLVSEIDKTEEFSAKLVDQLSFLFKGSDKEEQVEISVVESLLKEGLKTRFLSPEYVALCRMFYNTSSLKQLLEQSMVESDFENCASLISESEGCKFRIPNLKDFKNELDKSLWLNNAIKCSQKQVTYSFLSEVLESTPDNLKDHELYHKLKEKNKNASDWLERIKDPKFSRIISVDHRQLLNTREKESNKERRNDLIGGENYNSECVQLGRESGLKPEELESIYQSYQKIDVIIPCYKNIESMYHMWKRFERRLKRLDKMIVTENCSNVTMESLGVLQHSENIAEYLDIKDLLTPIKDEVEVSLEFERKCRSMINKFNNWSITNECVKIRSDWNVLINLRKNAKVSKHDIVDVIKMINVYKNIKYGKSGLKGSGQEEIKNEDEKGREEFEEYLELKEEFKKLKIKNWPLFRNLEEICNSGEQLKERTENGLKDLKEGFKSDDVVANIIAITLEILRFGANLNLEDKMLRALKYCLWSKKIYSSLDKLYKILELKSEVELDKNKEKEDEKDINNVGINSEMESKEEGNDDVDKGGERKGKGKGKEKEDNEYDYECERFIRIFRNLAREPQNEYFEELVDTEYSMGSYINIESPKNSKFTTVSFTDKSRDEKFKWLIDSYQIFSLSESDLVKVFGDP